MSESIDLIKTQQEFINMMKLKGRSPNTLKNYRTDLNCFNEFFNQRNKGLTFSRFEIQQVKEYSSFLDKKYNSNNSKRRRVQALRMFFDFLIETSRFESNPVKSLPTSPKFVDIPRPVSFSHLNTMWQKQVEGANESKELLELKYLRNLNLINLIFYAGLKVSNLTHLKRSQISCDHAGIYRVLVISPKRDPYTVALAPSFGGIYELYLSKLDKYNVEFEEIFFNANAHRILSGGISARGIELLFEDFRKKYSIQVTPKSLRQAGIFNWLHQGESEQQIKEWLGVAPGYSLLPYVQIKDQHYYEEEALEEFSRQLLQ